MGVRKRLKLILGIAAVLAVGSLALMVFGPESSPPEGDLKPLPKDVDVSLSRIRYTQTRDGIPRWALEADTAELSLDAGETRIKDLKMTFSPGRSSHPVVLTARNGVVNTSAGEVEARGDVEVQGKEYRVSTEQLRYRESDGTISADGLVKISIGPCTITGKGLLLSLENRSMELISNVHAKLPIERDRGAGP